MRAEECLGPGVKAALLPLVLASVLEEAVGEAGTRDSEREEGVNQSSLQFQAENAPEHPKS